MIINFTSFAPLTPHPTPRPESFTRHDSLVEPLLHISPAFSCSHSRPAVTGESLKSGPSSMLQLMGEEASVQAEIAAVKANMLAAGLHASPTSEHKPLPPSPSLMARVPNGDLRPAATLPPVYMDFDMG